ncbi:MAG: DUF1491 family protein [Hyphomicrobiaceae bacterium]
MRLKAEIWVQGYLRICAANGIPAVLVARGDADAGAIYIKLNRLDGTAEVFAPAPAGMSGLESDRRWVRASAGPIPEADADQVIRRQRDFDADLWVVEVEDARGRHHLDDWLVQA